MTLSNDPLAIGVAMGEGYYIAVGPSLWLRGGWDPKVDLFECFGYSFVKFFYSRVSRKQVVCNPDFCGYEP